MKKAAAFPAVLALLFPVLAAAHHGWAAFDPKVTLTFKAKVTEFHFVNPHSVVDFEVKDEHGKTQKWEGELTSNLRLSLKGWTATTLETGNEITISGYPAQSGSHVIRVTRITLANGKDLELEPGN
ncbi:MAG: hypothetical protein JOZ22_15065 [Acidobacteriia bacterium]|nr:hypothetical protein [Terriglobia bacterium]